MKQIQLFFVLLLTISGFRVQAAYAGNMDFKKDFGAIGDGNADDSKAWSEAIAYFNKEKSGVLNVPAGVYRIGKQKVNQDPKDGIVYASLVYGHLTLFEIDGLVIQGEVDKSGKPLSIFKYLDGVKYGYFNPVDGDKPIDVSKDAQAIGGVVLSLAWNCKNITIKNLELDGNFPKGTYYPAPSGKEGSQLVFLGISSYGARNLLIENVYAHHFGLDGFYIETPRDTLPEGKFHTVLSNCRSEYNGRQGLSFTVGTGLKVSKSSFRFTGMGGIRIAPGANVDIENHDNTGAPLSNSLFEDCVISSNKGGSGSVNLAGKVNNITFRKCTLDAGDMIEGTNRAYAIQMNFSPSRNVTFDQCIVRGVFLMYQQGGKKMDVDGKTVFKDCTFKDNLPLIPSKTKQPLIDMYDEIEFDNCRFYVHPDRLLFRSSPVNNSDNKEQTVLLKKCKVYNLKTGKADKSQLKGLTSRFKVSSK